MSAIMAGVALFVRAGGPIGERRPAVRLASCFIEVDAGADLFLLPDVWQSRSEDERPVD